MIKAAVITPLEPYNDEDGKLPVVRNRYPFIAWIEITGLEHPITDNLDPNLMIIEMIIEDHVLDLIDGDDDFLVLWWEVHNG